MAVDIPLTSTSDALFVLLSSIDLSVPGRSEGRTTDHVETWTTCRLLSTLAAAGLLTFPVSATRRDRPDLLIQDGAKTIGVEITEAISKQYAAYCALAEREFPDVFLEPAHFRWDSPERTVEEMRTLLCQKRLTSEGWVDDHPEREWALFMQSVVDNKLKKLARPDFAKFDQNWLAIYDNLPMPNIYLSNAIGFLRPLITDRWSRVPGFDTLLIEHGPVIARITARGSDHLLLKDLWGNGNGVAP
ncbi:MAG: hypothetical protein HY607_06215 [Planctomycetes bacterium]|nr:hypothetical protein [Planctomycetota bacterium]